MGRPSSHGPTSGAPSPAQCWHRGARPQTPRTTPRGGPPKRTGGETPAAGACLAERGRRAPTRPALGANGPTCLRPAGCAGSYGAPGRQRRCWRRAAPWQRAAPRGGGARAPRAPLLGRWFGPARARAGAVRRSPGPGRPPRGAEGTRRLGARGSAGPPLGVWAQQAHAQIGCQPKKVGVLT